MNRQIRMVGAGMMILFLALFVRLNFLQLFHARALQKSPTNGTRVVNEYNHPRGAILSADGATLAQSIRAPKGSPFTYERVYPTGSLFADVTGYYSFIYGADGVERTYNDLLDGSVQKAGFPTNLTDLRQLLAGGPQDLTLTMSQKLQEVARRGLAGREGSVVALDPSTGAVLAMYSNPSFDPAALSQLSTVKEQEAWKKLLATPGNPLSPGAYRNRWPPGSTFKIITASAVYDHRPSLANRVFPVLSALPLPQTTNELHNFDRSSCGGQILELFTVSCDTGFGKIGLDLGAHDLYSQATAFGFDSVPPIDLPDAAPSVFPAPSSFARNLPTLAYSAIGQENVAATPLEIAMDAGAIADHGKVMVPHVLSYVSDSQGRVVGRYADKVWRRATSAATAAKVTTLMESVVSSPDGTGGAAAIPGVEVAGKTGTSQTGSNPPRTDDWFAAFAPAAHPTIAVAVVLLNQGNGVQTQGGTLAAPIAKSLIETWLGEYPVKGAGDVVHADTGRTGGSSGTAGGSTTSTTTGATNPTTSDTSTTTVRPGTTTTSTTTGPTATTTAPATSTTSAPATTSTSPATSSPPSTSAPGASGANDLSATGAAGRALTTGGSA